MYFFLKRFIFLIAIFFKIMNNAEHMLDKIHDILFCLIQTVLITTYYMTTRSHARKWGEKEEFHKIHALKEIIIYF